MKLYEKLGDTGFHTTIFTTFGVDFDAFENIALARLRSSGCRNNILIADQRMVGHALSGASAPPKSAGRLYTVVGSGERKGVFHPKVILQLGRRRGRVIVSSANATASGLAGNLELAGVVECDQEKNGSQALVCAAFAFVSAHLPPQHRTLSRQLAWAQARTPWLQYSAVTDDSKVVLADGTQAAFLGSNAEQSIVERLLTLVGTERVDRLVVLSPYWDLDLAALRVLVREWRPKSTCVLIDRDRALFPVNALSRIGDIEIFDIAPFVQGRFAHAKMILAGTKDADHVLFGSANCTSAALGRDGARGINAEACLYRKLPANTLLSTLGLSQFVSEAEPLRADNIPPFALPDELPLDELSRVHPGSFECHFDKLIWRPASNVNPDKVEIELLTANEIDLPCTLRPLVADDESERSYEIRGATERPAMARLVFDDGSVSVPEIVSLFDALQNEVREARGKKLERIAEQLDAETEEGVWLLEVLDQLESLEDQSASSPRRIDHSRNLSPEDQNYTTLEYEKFIAGRRMRVEGSAVGRNSLSGSELSFVRAFLNRVLKLSDGDESHEEHDEESAFERVFDMGDEVDNAQDALESGRDFDDDASRAQPDSETVRRARIAKRRADRKQIVDAVDSFNERIRERARIGLLTSIDLLRLRAILTIVSASGSPGIATDSAARTSLQVLPIAGDDDSWPRTLGKTLFALFGGKNPPIATVKIDDIHDQIPDDLMECWACCYWAIQACLAAAQAQRQLASTERFILNLRNKVYSLTGLSAAELLGDGITVVMQRMSDRFADRIGIDGESIRESHRSYVLGVGGDAD